MNRKLECLCIVMLSCCFCAIAVRDVYVQTKPKEDSEEKTFKVKTELVEIHAVVTDGQGHIIENLKKEDFELLENNQPTDRLLLTQPKHALIRFRIRIAGLFLSLAPNSQPNPRPNTVRDIPNVCLNPS